MIKHYQRCAVQAHWVFPKPDNYYLLPEPTITSLKLIFSLFKDSHPMQMSVFVIITLLVSHTMSYYSLCHCCFDCNDWETSCVRFKIIRLTQRLDGTNMRSTNLFSHIQQSSGSHPKMRAHIIYQLFSKCCNCQSGIHHICYMFEFLTLKNAVYKLSSSYSFLQRCYYSFETFAQIFQYIKSFKFLVLRLLCFDILLIQSCLKLSIL